MDMQAAKVGWAKVWHPHGGGPAIWDPVVEYHAAGAVWVTDFR